MVEKFTEFENAQETSLNMVKEVVNIIRERDLRDDILCTVFITLHLSGDNASIGDKRHS